MGEVSGVGARPRDEIVTPAETARAVRAYDFCLHDGPRTSEEMFWACDHPGLGDRDAWVIARYDGGVLVRLQRFERWADQAAARQRWDALIARRAEAGPPSTGAREQLDLEDELPAPGAWLRGLVVDGATLTVALAVPASAELRFAAAELFETLARAAIDGVVEGTLDGRPVDYYPSGADDD